MKKNRLKNVFAGFASICVLNAGAAWCPYALISCAADAEVLYGDANDDGEVGIADVVKVMMYASDKNSNPMTEKELNNADVNNRGDGVFISDALSIQKKLAQAIDTLPESWMDEPDPVSDITYIHLKNTSIETEGENVSVEGTTVTITASGTYYVDGTLDDGQILVNVPDETIDAETVKIFLNGVNITGASAPAIFVENAENTSINLVEGTINVLNDGVIAYADDYLENAVIHAKDDLTIKGSGTLEINAANQYAIHCNNDVKFNGGTVNIVTLTADAIRGKSSVTVKDGIINIDSKGDGIKSTKGNVAIEGGTLVVKAGNDAVQAESTIDISGGRVVAGGDRGLTSASGTNITGGSVIATATDYQADLVTASQGTLLLNCIDDASNTDGCWKKANSIGISDTAIECAEFTKKYKYVLISDAAIESTGTYILVNSGTGSVVTHTNDTNSVFAMNGYVTTFETVNPNGNGGVVDPAANAYIITLSGASVLTDAPTDTATVSGGVITITKPGEFSVSGSGSEVQIVVDVDKTLYPEAIVDINLMGADITNTTTSPIYVASVGDECRIVAKSGYTNTITDGTSYLNADEDAGAIYSKDDLKIKGSGILIVNGNCLDGIVSKDDLKIWNGNVTVNAVDDCIRGKDSVRIGDPDDTDYTTLNLTLNSSAGDGVKTTNTTDEGKGYITVNGGTIDINVMYDGFQSTSDVTINNGAIDIYTYEGSTYIGTSGSTGSTGGWGGPGGGGMNDGNSNKVENSAKGIKSDGTINILGGNITIDSSDDSLHSAGAMTVTGGTITLASADDGMHSDTALTIGTEGDGSNFASPYIEITKSYEGVEGVDITLNSGTVITKSSDDGYNAAGGTDSSGNTSPGGWNPGGGFGGGNQTLTINGGCTYVDAGGDGLDSNGTLTVNGGYVFVSQTGSGNAPIDCDSTWTYNGGVVIAGGSSDMFSESVPQSYQFVNSSGVGINANEVVTFADSSGNVIATMTFANAASAVVVCAPESGIFYKGGTLSGAKYIISSDANRSIKAGYGGTISNGTQLSSGSAGGGNQGGPGGRS